MNLPKKPVLLAMSTRLQPHSNVVIFSRAPNNNITAGPQTVSPVYHESRVLLDNPRWRTPSEKSCIFRLLNEAAKSSIFPHPREKCLDSSSCISGRAEKQELSSSPFFIFQMFRSTFR